MSADYSGSLSTIARLMNGRAPGIPNFGFSFVDVRDVADLHLRAMLKTRGRGRTFHRERWVLLVRRGRFDLAGGVRSRRAQSPKRRLPDWLVRLVAIYDRPIKNALERLSQRMENDASKAQRVLAGAQGRPVRR